MGIPKPLSQSEAPAELRDIYAGMQKAIGHMPNILAVLARSRETLRTLLQRGHDRGQGGSQVQRAGLPEDVARQYLPVLNPRPHCFGEAGRRDSSPD